MAHQRVYETLRELRSEASDGTLIAITIANAEPEAADALFDVHGVTAESGEEVALGFQRWGTWLGMEVAPTTRHTYSAAQIVAHCIYEMTFYGYDEDTIAAAGAEVLRRSEELRHGRSTTISWDDLKSKLGLSD